MAAFKSILKREINANIFIDISGDLTDLVLTMGKGLCTFTRANAVLERDWGSINVVSLNGPAGEWTHCVLLYWFVLLKDSSVMFWSFFLYLF